MPCDAAGPPTEAVVREALAVATPLAREAGELARRALREGAIASRAKGARGDLVTPVDIAAERLIVDGIRRRFPDHEVCSEEAGRVGGPSPWTWLVDPLDGTNNVALGLALHGVCITLCHRGEPWAAVVHDGSRQRTLTAARGHGARAGGRPVCLPDGAEPPERTTVSWLQGYGVARDDRRAAHVRGALAATFKRTLATWAPAVDWALAATGGLGAVVAYRNELEDPPRRIAVDARGRRRGVRLRGPSAGARGPLRRGDRRTPGDGRRGRRSCAGGLTGLANLAELC